MTSLRLPISSELDADLDVDKGEKAAPDDGVPRRQVGLPREIAAKAEELGEIELECARLCPAISAILDEVVLARRSAVWSLASSAQHPGLRILWKTSIFQRMEYQRIFSIASPGLRTSRSVTSFQKIGLRPDGASTSDAWITVRSSDG